MARYAGPGYDMATGLGSIDAYNLLHQWTSYPAITSAVVPSVDRNPVFQTGGAWSFNVTLTEQAGIATRLTDFTVDGVSQSINIRDIPARAGVSSTVTLTGIAAPKTVVLGFKGVDASGATWSTEFPVPFRGPQVALSVAGVSNAASGDRVFAPGMILSVYGTGMGNNAQAAAAIPLPSYLAGFNAWVNGVEAPLYYVSPNQVNIQIPYETSAGTATLELGNPFENITYRFTVTNSGPGIFTLPNGRVNPTSSAARGQAATMFMTGEGAVSPTLATGNTPSSRTAIANLPKPRASVSVTVGGLPAIVDFIGIPSGLVGVTQINFRIPDGAAPRRAACGRHRRRGGQQHRQDRRAVRTLQSLVLRQFLIFTAVACAQAPRHSWITGNPADVQTPAQARLRPRRRRQGPGRGHALVPRTFGRWRRRGRARVRRRRV